MLTIICFFDDQPIILWVRVTLYGLGVNLTRISVFSTTFVDRAGICSPGRSVILVVPSTFNEFGVLPRNVRIFQRMVLMGMIGVHYVHALRYWAGKSMWKQ